MTFEERKNILSKDVLDVDDISKLLGVTKQTAYAVIRRIKFKTDRLGIQGKILIQDYIEYFNLDFRRYIVGQEQIEEEICKEEKIS